MNGEKALRGANKLAFCIAFDTKKQAKIVYRNLERERLESTTDDDRSIRKIAKDSKVVRKGKKVWIKGGYWLAQSFVEELDLPNETKVKID